MTVTSFREEVMIPLSRLKEGERGVIIKVQGSGPFRKRLQEMGFIKGTEVFVEKYAPLRDPVELIVKGYHVSLRVEEAAQVLVDRQGQEGA
jgi:Fe2+ transport system protein FeoA